MHSPQIIYKINERDRDLYFFYPPAETLKVVHCCNKFKETKSNQMKRRREVRREFQEEERNGKKYRVIKS